MTYLNGCPLQGGLVKVNRSKYQQVNLGRVGPDASGLTKDYTGTQLHRFKRAGSKNFMNICPPNQVLHLSNLPMGVTEAELRALIQPHAQVVAFKWLSSNRMALVQCSELADAVNALVHLHNHNQNGSYIRISFSKSSNI
jgi:RNA recognition motif/RNA recognition motif. (a.k.a. RRM, RBD, or RNP domain)